MASHASAFRMAILLAAVLAVSVLPSLACQEAQAPAPALAPAPAPAPVILCQDCDSRCESTSMCDAYVAAAGCGNACSGATPDCEPCRSASLQNCLSSCNEGCPRSCPKCNCPSVCDSACYDVARSQCKDKRDYSYYAVKSCHECQDSARTRCTDACNTDCKANCVKSG
ncbi:hypothetical protein VPH35_112846 [Triticum aestivum]